MIDFAQIGCCIRAQLYKPRNAHSFALQRLEICELNVGSRYVHLCVSDRESVSRMLKGPVHLNTRRAGGELESRQRNELVGKADFRIQMIKWFLVRAAIKNLESSASERIAVSPVNMYVRAQIPRGGNRRLSCQMQ